MTPEKLEDIRADIYAEPWKDPQLFPDLLHKAIGELGQIAVNPWPVFREWSLDEAVDRPPVQLWAERLLEQLGARARSGVPFGEPEYGDQAPTNPEEL